MKAFSFFMWFCVYATFVIAMLKSGAIHAQPPAKKDEKKIGNPTDVPVIQPKTPPQQQVEDLPKSTPPVATEEQTQALLPIRLLKNKVESMKAGTTAYVSSSAFRVDAKRRCWLHPHFITGHSKSEDRPLQISRDASGFHVILHDTYQWEAEDIESSSWIFKNWDRKRSGHRSNRKRRSSSSVSYN
jgi:hypothetical protein